MKLVACIPAKNESWILKYTLSALATFVDEIIVLDDGSTDDTVAIARACSKVSVVIEKGPQAPLARNEPSDWNRLTEAARQRGADWILYTDADEMLEPGFTQCVRSLIACDDVGVYRFRKISPWKGLDYYRTDAPRYDHKAAETLNPILIRVTPTLAWPNPKGSIWKRWVKRVVRGEKFKPVFGRIFPVGVEGKIVDRDDLVSVHFNHVDFTRLIRKQLFYAVNECKERPHRPVDDVVEWAYRGLDDSKAKFVAVDPKWLWQEYVGAIAFPITKTAPR
ncbi:MAG: glycosyltransferase family 2 protein [Silvanigrellales bacterium]|jgi:glycosyltransferase involved in cell wall biosynthesis|nr:glycosyltransferase family 2 protein [Silvanigrellales bacterium]